MTIDKELPQSEGEVQREILKQKYLRWKNLYLKLTEGNTSIENETQRQIMLFQLNQLENELKESHYTPYLNFIETTFNKQQHVQTSFIQLEHSSITNTILSIQMKYDDLSSPYNLNIPSKEDETDYANGMKPKSERNSHLSSVFQVNSWPIDCKRALYLSPINIDVNTITTHIHQHALQFHLTAPIGNVYVNNDDYKLIVFSDGGFGTVTYYDHVYTAKRIVFHLPSEHTFTKEQYRSEFEMQIICSDEYDNYIGVAVLFEKGEEEFQFLNVVGFSNEHNVLFAKKLRSGERVEIENSEYVKKGMNLNYLFGKDKNNKFVSYVGSTTTPPCKGNVRWFVMVNKVKISDKQVRMFPVVYGRFRNVRGTQGINGRELVLIG
jgi:carbonic anhydrase